MKALAPHTQAPDDTRLWSPSRVEAVGTGMPKRDPVALLLAEQRRDGAMQRLLLSGAAALLILLGSAGLFLTR